MSGMEPQPPPRVCIVIPCYNHARFLPAAVASVAAQTFRNWEMVIVDDGSADDTQAVAQGLIAQFAPLRIRLIAHTNRGQGASRNAAIAQTEAAYILPLDADDRIEPDMLAYTVAVLDAEPHLGFVTANVRFFGAEHGSWSGGEPHRERMIFDCRAVITTLFRRAAWHAVGGFPELRQRQGYEDWDFWLRLIEHGWAGRLVPLPLVWYRRLPGSALAQASSRDLYFRAELIVAHATLYPPAFAAWASILLREADAHPRTNYLARQILWCRWYAGYVSLVAAHAPHELPKTLLRPAFKLLGPQFQMYARHLAQFVRLSRAT